MPVNEVSYQDVLERLSRFYLEFHSDGYGKAIASMVDRPWSEVDPILRRASAHSPSAGDMARSLVRQFPVTAHLHAVEGGVVLDAPEPEPEPEGPTLVGWGALVDACSLWLDFPTTERRKTIAALLGLTSMTVANVLDDSALGKPAETVARRMVETLAADGTGFLVTGMPNTAQAVDPCKVEVRTDAEPELLATWPTIMATAEPPTWEAPEDVVRRAEPVWQMRVGQRLFQGEKADGLTQVQALRRANDLNLIGQQLGAPRAVTVHEGPGVDDV